jgi:hypothetical protein
MQPSRPPSLCTWPSLSLHLYDQLRSLDSVCRHCERAGRRGTSLHRASTHSPCHSLQCPPPDRGQVATAPAARLGPVSGDCTLLAEDDDDRTGAVARLPAGVRWTEEMNSGAQHAAACHREGRRTRRRRGPGSGSPWQRCSAVDCQRREKLRHLAPGSREPAVKMPSRGWFLECANERRLVPLLTRRIRKPVEELAPTGRRICSRRT